MKQLLFYLYAGFLSFVCAEGFAGSAPNWIIEPWAWLITYPLYMFHFFFFCNLAHITGRTSLGSLYLWGVLFGLYETWITKVAWAGYLGQDGFVFGSFLGFGIHETLGLIFFYHPVTSFLIPLTVLGALFPAIQKKFSLPNWLFGESRFQRVSRFSLIIIFGVVTAHNLPGITGIIFTWVPAIIISYTGYRFYSKQSHYKLTYTLPLSLKATIISGIIVFLMTIVGYFALIPERIPVGGFLEFKTFILYLAVLFFIYRKGHTGFSEQNYEVPPKKIWISFLAIFCLCFVLGTIKILFPALISVLALAIFLIFIPAGILLFYRLGIVKHL